MRELENREEILLIAKALDSELRLRIIDILNDKKQMNLNDLAEELGVTNGALTSHIRLMKKADILDIKNAYGKRGSQKICFIKENKFLIDTSIKFGNVNSYETEIPVGTFSNYCCYPTCGIATRSKIIGEVDNPSYFDDPLRSNACIVWLTRGFLEYRIPNYLKRDQKPVEIQFSVELSSEAPGFCDEWPSDIHFFLNNRNLGYWTSPGDFGSAKGLFTPDWWPTSWNQYGLLKLITVNHQGTFIDGMKMSDVRIDDLGIVYKGDIIFKMAVLEESQHVGGLTIFGRNFGNYNQSIRVRIMYEPQPKNGEVSDRA